MHNFGNANYWKCVFYSNYTDTELDWEKYKSNSFRHTLKMSGLEKKNPKPIVLSINEGYKMFKKPDREAFDAKELAVLDFVAHWHREQKRKYTGEPYVNHLGAVAKTVKEYTKNSLIVAAAFCHDLYEDTPCPEEDLRSALTDAGFNESEVIKINNMVWELTDEFVKEKYPELNRRNRKTQEAKRLWAISPDAQNVKYADLIDNSTDLAKNNTGFGRKYMEEMNQILEFMDKGLPKLYKLALQTAKDVGKQLEK